LNNSDYKRNTDDSHLPNDPKRKRTERSELVCPVGGGRLGPAEHPVEHFTLRVANDR
jgi:hypothetical protein